MRLEAEAIRDAMLAVSGLLDPRMFAPGTLDEGDPRRSVYLTVKRSHLIPMLSVFDELIATQSVGLRSTTTVAPQALALLNNGFVRRCAVGFAKRIAPDSNVPFDAAVESAYQLALGRKPSDAERGDAVEFLNTMSKTVSREQALADFCQAVLGLNEFVYHVTQQIERRFVE